MTPKILVAIPAYGGSIANDCVSSILRLAAMSQHRHIQLQFRILNIIGIDIARNVFASIVYHDKSLTHLFFVDSDIIFEPTALTRLLDADKPLIGCAYPFRNYDFAKALAAVKKTDSASALAAGLDFTIYMQDLSKPLKAVDGLCSVDGIGMGATLIRRDVFETLAKTVQVKQSGLYDKLSKKEIFGFFDLLRADGKDYLEDLSFCMRWRQTGGEVWALIDEEMGHVGPFAFRGRLSDALR